MLFLLLLELFYQVEVELCILQLRVQLQCFLVGGNGLIQLLLTGLTVAQVIEAFGTVSAGIQLFCGCVVFSFVLTGCLPLGIIKGFCCLLRFTGLQ